MEGNNNRQERKYCISRGEAHQRVRLLSYESYPVVVSVKCRIPPVPLASSLLQRVDVSHLGMLTSSG